MRTEKRTLQKAVPRTASRAEIFCQISSDLKKTKTDEPTLSTHVLALYATFAIRDWYDSLLDHEVYELIKLTLEKNCTAFDIHIEVNFPTKSTSPRTGKFDIADCAIYFNHPQTLNLVLEAQFKTWEIGPDALKLNPTKTNSHNRSFFTKLLISYEIIFNELNTHKDHKDKTFLKNTTDQLNKLIANLEKLIASIPIAEREALLNNELLRIRAEFTSKEPTNTLLLIQSFMASTFEIAEILKLSVGTASFSHLPRLTDTRDIELDTKTSDSSSPETSKLIVNSAAPTAVSAVDTFDTKPMKIKPGLYPSIKISRDSAIEVTHTIAAERIGGIINRIDQEFRKKRVRKADLKQVALRGFRDILIYPDSIYVSLTLFLLIDWMRKGDDYSKLISEDDLIEILRDDKKRPITLDFLIAGRSSKNDLILVALEAGYTKLAKLLISKEDYQLKSAPLNFIKIIFSNHTFYQESFVKNTLNFIESSVKKADLSTNQRERLSFQRIITLLKLRVRNFLNHLNSFPGEEEAVINSLLKSLIPSSKSEAFPINALRAISDCTDNETIKSHVTIFCETNKAIINPDSSEASLSVESLHEAEKVLLESELLKAISTEDTETLAHFTSKLPDESTASVFITALIIRIQRVDLKAVFFLLNTLSQNQLRYLIDYKLMLDSPLTLLDQIILWANHEIRYEYHRGEAGLRHEHLSAKSNEDVGNLHQIINLILRKSFSGVKAETDYLFGKFKSEFNTPINAGFSAFLIASLDLLTEVQASVKPSKEPVTKDLSKEENFYFLKVFYQENFNAYVINLNKAILSACINPEFEIENFCHNFWRANLFFSEYRSDGEPSRAETLAMCSRLGTICDRLNLLVESIVTRHPGSSLAQALIKFLADAHYFSKPELKSFIAALPTRSSDLSAEATMAIFKLYEKILNENDASITEDEIITYLNTLPSCEYLTEHHFHIGNFDLSSCAHLAKHQRVLKILLSRERALNPGYFLTNATTLNRQGQSWFSKWLLLIEMYYQSIKDSDLENPATHETIFKDLISEFCSALAEYPIEMRAKLLLTEFRLLNNLHKTQTQLAHLILKNCLLYLGQDIEEIDASLPVKHDFERYHLTQIILDCAQKTGLALNAARLAEKPASKAILSVIKPVKQATLSAAAGAGAEGVETETSRTVAKTSAGAGAPSTETAAEPTNAYSAMSIEDLHDLIEGDAPATKKSKRRKNPTKPSTGSGVINRPKAATRAAESTTAHIASSSSSDPDPASSPRSAVTDALPDLSTTIKSSTKTGPTDSSSDSGSDNPDSVPLEASISADPTPTIASLAGKHAASNKASTTESRLKTPGLATPKAADLEIHSIAPEQLAVEEFKARRNELSKFLFEWSSELSADSSNDASKKLLEKIQKRQNHLKTIASQFKKTKTPSLSLRLISDDASTLRLTHAQRYTILAAKLLESLSYISGTQSGYLLEAVAALQVPFAMDEAVMDSTTATTILAAATALPSFSAETATHIASTEAAFTTHTASTETVKTHTALQLRISATMPIVTSLKNALTKLPEFSTLVMPGSQLYLPYPLDIDLRMNTAGHVRDEKINEFIGRLAALLDDHGFRVLKIITVPDGSGTISIKLAARGEGEGYNEDNHMPIDLVVFTNPAKAAFNHTSCSSSELNLTTFELSHDTEVLEDVRHGIFSIRKRPLGDDRMQAAAQIHILKLLSRAWSESRLGAMGLDENSVNLINEIIEAASNLKVLEEKNPLLARALKEWVTKHFSDYQRGVNFDHRTTLLFDFLEHVGMRSSIPFMTKITTRIIIDDFKDYKTGDKSFKRFDELQRRYVAHGWPLEELSASAIPEALAQHFFSYFLSRDTNYFNKMYLLLGDLKLEANRKLMLGAFKLNLGMYFNRYQTAGGKGDISRLKALMAILKLPNSQRPALDALLSEALRGFVQDSFDASTDSKSLDYFNKAKALIEFCNELEFSLVVPAQGSTSVSMHILSLNPEKTRIMLSSLCLMAPPKSLLLNLIPATEDEKSMSDISMAMTAAQQQTSVNALVTGAGGSGFFSGSIITSAAGAGAMPVSPLSSFKPRQG